jgi:hypothetical protein
MIPREVWRALRWYGDYRAARRGPAALGKRMVRRRAFRALARMLRRL